MKKLFAIMGMLLASAGLVRADEPKLPPLPPLPPAPQVTSQPAATTAANACCCPPVDPSAPVDCSRYWFSADYLFGWVKRGPTPPLVSTGPNNVLFSGSLDIPGTQVLFGNHLDYGTQSGWQARGGLWLDDDRTLGFEVAGFQLLRGTDSFSLSGDASGQPFFGRPFINAQTGNQNVYFVSQNFSDPALSAKMTGAIDINSSSSLWGLEANGVFAGWRSNNLKVDFLTGFRWLELSEDLRINESLRNLAPGGGVFFLGNNVNPAESVATFDHFDTRNNFYGGQIGARLDWQRGRFNVGMVGKVALGMTHQEVTINGGSVLLGPTGNAITAVPGGVQALTSNIGRYSSDQFTVVPELGINLAYDVTERLRVRVGYSFLYWSSVARPGQQIDFTLNPGLVPTDATYGTAANPARPGPTGSRSDFWAQTVNLGFEFRY